jgi:hypothetical protein
MFLGYIHYFRALAILFIVAGHSIDVFVWDSVLVERLLRIFISNGSVLFVFIAGYLFQHLSVNFYSKKYYISKFKNVIVPYIIISIPAILIFVLVIERDYVWDGFYNNYISVQVVLFYITGMHLAPLWFIPMIAIFYIIAPLLIKADRNEVIYFMLPIFVVLSCFVGRGLPYQSFVHFFSVYLLGMFCSRYKATFNLYVSKNIYLVCLFMTVLLLSMFEFYYMNGTMTYINYLQKITLSLFFLGLFIKFNCHLRSKFVSIIADTSFGVFFIHSYFLTMGKLSYLKIYGDQPLGNIFSYLLATIFTLLICSFVITQIKRVIGKKSKFFVGS